MSRAKNVWVPAVVTVAAVGAAAGAVAASRRREDVQGFFVRQTLERPAASRSHAELRQALERSGPQLTARVTRAGDSDHNRRVLRHIIGIERWGTSRLEHLISGSPLLELDSHRSYLPEEDSSWDALLQAFSTTRARTIDAARRLEQRPPAPGTTLPHNGLGDLSEKGWLRYLTLHADLESRKVRGRHEPPALGEAQPA
ncbi:DinB family protein [Deinococcus sonorensis]|uniref:DinB family protein n=2 Tax=Deinococcus sonorensis TaxID=309891 RepID=A0AAU7U8Q9_9DEIO